MYTYNEIFKQLHNAQYLPVYLLMGEEPFFIDQISDYIEENALEEDQRDFNQTIFYGKEILGDEIVALAKEIPFGADKKVIIVKEAKDLKKMDYVLNYMARPENQTILVICYKYGTIRATQYKAIEKVGAVFKSELIKDYKLWELIVERAKFYNFTIQKNAAELLAEHIGNDLSRIDNEIKKLQILIPEKSEISSNIIEQYIGISKEYNIFELEKALSSRDFYKINKITLNFCAHLKENPNIKTISNLFSYYKKMLDYHLSDHSPQSNARIFGNLSPYILESNCKIAQSHSVIELCKIIAILREYDLKAKGVDSALDDAELLKEMIYKITH